MTYQDYVKVCEKHFKAFLKFEKNGGFMYEQLYKEATAEYIVAADKLNELRAKGLL
jgi:hypothetical protein